MKRIILCRPAGPRNVGAILRAALNFGPAEVVIKEVGRPSLLEHPDFDLMSHGGEEARAAIRVVDTMEEALEGCHHAVAFTARARRKERRVNWRERAPELVPIGDDGEQRLALIFGSEESGLTREEAAAAQELAHLRTAPEHTSLNLAQAVTVVLYSLFTGNEVHQREPQPKRLDQRGRTFLKERMTEVLAGEIAFTDAAARDITGAIERMVTRAPLEPRDARAWHIILRSLGSAATPGQFGLEEQPRDARRQEALERNQRRLEGAEGPADGPEEG